MTSWSLIWLVATVLLVAGGALNLSQRAYHDLPPTDGVAWVQRDGALGVLNKPVNIDQLSAKLNEILAAPAPAQT